ncbi:MAG TPA: MBL fold metallo-hydrolase [Roseiflexaceae bacterium]|nr:MBL fold metallo-hydrolase [Roseiflexaceae bacterium]
MRKRCSALIDGDLLIDLGPDLMAAAMQHGIALHSLRYCLQTHHHSDHLDPHHFESRSAYCGVYGTPRLAYYAGMVAIEHASAILGRPAPIGTSADAEADRKMNLDVIPVAIGQTFAVGPYQVNSVPAAHCEGAMLYIVERDGRRLFYATDTGPLGETAWAQLATLAPIDVLVLDHTFGFKKRSSGHLNAEQFQETVAQMRDIGLVRPDTRVIAHHLGHHSHPIHEETEAYAAQRGYGVAYDGMQVEI